jgi:type II secretory pathway component PulF
MLGTRDMARASLYQRLASMENAGIPIRDSVAQIQAQGGFGGSVLGGVSDRLNDGEEIGDAFCGAQGLTEFEGRLVQAGAKAGTLPDAFRALAEHYEDSANVKRKIAGELAYPIFLLHAAMFLPNVAVWFTDGLPAFLEASLLPLATCYAVVLLAFVAHRVMHKAQPLVVDTFMLQVPVVGKLLRKRAIITALRVFRISYANGISTLESLEAAASVCPNERITRDFQSVRDQVANGSSLALAFGGMRGLPSVVLDMISTGETSGRLDTLLEKAEEQLELEVEQVRGFLIKALGLCAFLLVAAFVAFKVLSFFGNLYGQVGL